jgi:hypothetical protein
MRLFHMEYGNDQGSCLPVVLLSCDACLPSVCDPQVGEELDSLDPLERLLRCDCVTSRG